LSGGKEQTVTDTIDATATDGSASTAAVMERAAGQALARKLSTEDLADELMQRAQSDGVSLVGPGGLLADLTKQVLEAMLEGEMTDHVGYAPHDPAGHHSGNSRNGTRAKTVLTDNAGPVQVEVPRDRDGSFEPVIVKKRQRRLSDVDAVVLSLYARGLTTGEISAHFAEIYAASVSKDTVSRITDKVVEDMQAWSCRPLQRVYAAIFIDAIMVKVRDGSPKHFVQGGAPWSATSRSTPRSGSTCTGTGTCSGCGPATVPGSRRSSG
jgi:putative transposase